MQNNIANYFEIDVDSVVGYKKVMKTTAYLERKTGTQCIPVWHKTRGIDEYKRLCRDYKRIAVGGFALHEINVQEYISIVPLIDYAHAHDCLVHGLGFTNQKWFDILKFDSVDSTSWKSGGRFGQQHHFNGKKIVTTQLPKNTAKWQEIDTHNLLEWCKYQSYVDTQEFDGIKQMYMEGIV